jgi:hypothetical protein
MVIFLLEWPILSIRKDLIADGGFFLRHGFNIRSCCYGNQRYFAPLEGIGDGLFMKIRPIERLVELISNLMFDLLLQEKTIEILVTVGIVDCEVATAPSVVLSSTSGCCYLLVALRVEVIG